MKNFKTFGLLSLCAALCASVAIGSFTLTAKAADEVSPYDTISLETGASVRYADSSQEMGFSYRLMMPATEYEKIKDEAVFGIYLAPQDYYAVHPFNSVENIEQYYDTVNTTPAAGKAKLYDYQGTMGATDGETVYFRGSLIGVLDGSNNGANNLTRDFRAVGYVKYTVDGKSVYKFIQAEDESDNIRSMAFVAEKAIEANAEKIKTTADETVKADLTAKNAKLKEFYIDKVEEPFGANAEQGEVTRVYNCENKTLTLPQVATINAVQKNTYWKDKYEYKWTLTDTNETVVNGGESLTDKQGIFTLACTAIKGGVEKVVYTQPYQVTDLGETTVNGETLTPKGDVMIKNADGTYKNEYESVTHVAQYYPKLKATGDFVFNAEITVTGDKDPEVFNNDPSKCGSGAGFIISCGAGKELTVFTNKNNAPGGAGKDNKLIFLVNTTPGGTMMTANYFMLAAGTHFGKVGTKVKFSVERIGNEISFKHNQQGKVITFCEDGTVVPGNGITFTGDSAKVGEHVGTMLKNGNETAFGAYREFGYRGEYTYNPSLTNKTNALRAVTASGESSATAKGNEALTKQADGSHQSEYAETGNTLQYIPATKQTGDFTLGVATTDADNAASQRIYAERANLKVDVVIARENGNLSRLRPKMQR